jgi:hypothetical protein
MQPDRGSTPMRLRSTWHTTLAHMDFDFVILTGWLRSPTREAVSPEQEDKYHRQHIAMSLMLDLYR